VFHSRPPVLPDEDAAWQIQLAGQKALAEGGYAQYEVSAYAKQGAQCRHNMNYWLFGDYVGIGAGAHGKVSILKPEKILRTVKPKQPREYQAEIGRAALPAGEGNVVAATDLPFEFMLNALRLNDGFSSDCYRARTGLALETISEKLAKAEDRGLLDRMPSGWRATELGRRFLNDLQAGFLA
jgi:coproporphyrinogen III oxidase-like Fe-S oxidoreductase